MKNIVFIPKVKGFENKLKEFIKDCNEVKICVRKFDETISQKANKSQFF